MIESQLNSITEKTAKNTVQFKEIPADQQERPTSGNTAGVDNSELFAHVEALESQLIALKAKAKKYQATQTEQSSVING